MLWPGQAPLSPGLVRLTHKPMRFSSQGARGV